MTLVVCYLFFYTYTVTSLIPRLHSLAFSHSFMLQEKYWGEASYTATACCTRFDL